MSKEKNVVSEGGLLTFKSEFERVDLMDKQYKRGKCVTLKVKRYDLPKPRAICKQRQFITSKTFRICTFNYSFHCFSLQMFTHDVLNLRCVQKVVARNFQILFPHSEIFTNCYLLLSFSHTSISPQF